MGTKTFFSKIKLEINISGILERTSKIKEKREITALCKHTCIREFEFCTRIRIGIVIVTNRCCCGQGNAADSKKRAKSLFHKTSNG